ncbi:hypothetical protein F4809DRAFT_585660 [Biscogniauxia mediterranea]|nr:hypothetical protein F4809DRAFT_585660 [Biscogniauxia mediterranea]
MSGFPEGHQVNADRPRSPPRRQRACLPCTKAKARCNFEGNKLENGCDRCRRLRIACTPQTKRSLRRPRQVKSSQEPHSEGSSTARVATSTLDTNCRNHTFACGQWGISHSEYPSTTTSVQSPQNPTPLDRGYETSSTIEDRRPQLSSTPVQHPASLPRNPRPLISGVTGNAQSNPGFGISWAQAEQAVAHFKSGYIPHFPFVALDPEISAQQLLRDKPLLFRVILLAAGRLTLAKQREIRRSINAYIGQHVLVMEERDIGLLQGLITYIAWGHHDFYMDRTITQLIYLAAGYVHSLGITHHSYYADQWAMVALSPKNAKEVLSRYSHAAVEPDSRTLEGQRAFLGSFYVLSINCSQFGRRNGFRSEYVGYCLESLGRSAEYRSDFHLIKMMEFRQFTQRIAEEFPSVLDLGSGKVFTVEISDKMQSMRLQLDQLFENISREHPTFVLLWITQLSILSRLYLPATYMIAETEEASSHQLQCMLSGLQIARSFFTTLLSLGPERLLRCPFIVLTDLALVIVASARLLLVDIDGWNLEDARKTLDFVSTLDKNISLLAATKRLSDQRAAETTATYPSSFAQNTPEDEANDPWIQYIEKILTIKTWYEQQITVAVEGTGEHQETYRQPALMSLTNTQSWNHFFLGLLGNDSWNFDF